jgi:cystathionine beta-lyase/cystathionine gamma-synthase
MKKETILLHNGNEIDRETGALSIPIYNTSTFHQKDFEKAQEWEYSRSGNPTRNALENTLAAIENGSHGYAFSSGMAAISSTVLALFRPGDHLVATKDIYGGAWRFFSKFIGDFGVEISFADFTDIESAEKLIKPNTKAIYIESPTNPLMKIIDIARCAKLAKNHGLISIIDNTFMTPFLCRPLDLGIDVSIHSATKFLGGHSDLIAGAVMTKSDELARKIGFTQNALGAVLGPNDSWLLMRGIKTLGARMTAEGESSGKIASWLKDQPWVSEVLYPGLPGHPGYDINRTQSDGPGSVLSFKTDRFETAKRILKNTKVWSIAVSLGGVDSIMSYPVTMSHASIPAETRKELGISDTLIRLSVGLEHADDLIEDIAQAAGGSL